MPHAHKKTACNNHDEFVPFSKEWNFYLFTLASVVIISGLPIAVLSSLFHLCEFLIVMRMAM